MLHTTPIAKPPWSKLGKRLESLCRKALYEFSMVDTPSIAIALSGGKDSLTLLYLLSAISGRGFPTFKFHAIHVGGAFTCGAGVDEAFLKRICAALDIPLSILESKQEESTLECYSCSRERRKLIFDCAKEHGFTTVAFGHHRDDSNNTLLMNLLHKAEFAANLPKIHMHDYGITIIRPLILAAEEEIKEFAKQNNFQRISCGCPVGQRSLRKKTADLLDEIEKIFPNTRENLLKASFEYGSKKALSK